MRPDPFVGLLADAKHIAFYSDRDAASTTLDSLADELEGYVGDRFAEQPVLTGVMDPTLAGNHSDAMSMVTSAITSVLQAREA